MNYLMQEMINAAKETPRMFFAPLIGAIHAVKREFRAKDDGKGASPTEKDGGKSDTCSTTEDTPRPHAAAPAPTAAGKGTSHSDFECVVLVMKKHEESEMRMPGDNERVTIRLIRGFDRFATPPFAEKQNARKNIFGLR